MFPLGEVDFFPSGSSFLPLGTPGKVALSWFKLVCPFDNMLGVTRDLSVIGR